VVYDPEVVSIDKIKQSIINTGYQTGEVREVE
jgi:copper chaperone CopZ